MQGLAAAATHLNKTQHNKTKNLETKTQQQRCQPSHEPCSVYVRRELGYLLHGHVTWRLRSEGDSTGHGSGSGLLLILLLLLMILLKLLLLLMLLKLSLLLLILLKLLMILLLLQSHRHTIRRIPAEHQTIIHYKFRSKQGLQAGACVCRRRRVTDTPERLD
jgi:hypothetical protein